MEDVALVEQQMRAKAGPCLPSFDEVNELLENDLDDELDAAQLITKPNCSPSPHELMEITEIPDTAQLAHGMCYKSTMCMHEECLKVATLEMARGFGVLNMVDRVRLVRAMLFSLTALQGAYNELMKDSTIATRKRRKLDGQDCISRTTTVFSLKEKRVWLKGFAAVTQLSTETIRWHTAELGCMLAPELYTTSKGNNRAGKHGLQRIVVRAFLIDVTNSFGMECPWGGGCQDQSPLRILPSYFTKTKLYKDYVTKWKELSDCVVEHVSRFVIRERPVVYNHLLLHWQDDMPFLRIASTWSDFCDTCTTLRDTIYSLPAADPRVLAAQPFLTGQMNQARTEFQPYKHYQRTVSRAATHLVRHFVFDYVEKVLLPRLQKQPGQLHFITGLKFDLFGISCNNESTTDIYMLVEGFWHQEKTANTVIAMLHHSIESRFPDKSTCCMGKRLVLPANNCSGQNKNRFVLFYILWRTMVGYEQEVMLLFQVAGHTKNVCDGAFGNIKRRLLRTDAITPAQMMQIVDEIATSNTCIPGTFVRWRNWKKIFEKYSTVPSNLKISRAHVFMARKTHPGVVFVKELSNSTSEL